MPTDEDTDAPVGDAVDSGDEEERAPLQLLPSTLDIEALIPLITSDLKERRFSQQRLCAQLSISPESLSDLLGGEDLPSPLCTTYPAALEKWHLDPAFRIDDPAVTGTEPSDVPRVNQPRARAPPQPPPAPEDWRVPKRREPPPPAVLAEEPAPASAPEQVPAASPQKRLRGVTDVVTGDDGEEMWVDENGVPLRPPLLGGAALREALLAALCGAQRQDPAGLLAPDAQAAGPSLSLIGLRLSGCGCGLRWPHDPRSAQDPRPAPPRRQPHPSPPASTPRGPPTDPAAAPHTPVTAPRSNLPPTSMRSVPPRAAGAGGT